MDLVASLLSSVLSFIGVQLSSKAKSVQVLSMSQGAILVLVRYGSFGSLMHSASEFETLSTFFSSIMAFVVSVLAEYITRRVSSSKTLTT